MSNVYFVAFCSAKSHEPMSFRRSEMLPSERRWGKAHTIRRAVTLLEVIFSMGVILIGLLGLLSILPLAGRRAQESVSLSVGSAIGEQMVSELEARRYLGDGRLRPVPATTGTAVSNLTYPSTTPLGSFCLDPIFASSTTVPGFVRTFSGRAIPVGPSKP